MKKELSDLFPIGKFKGLTVAQLLEQHKQYCQWFCKQQWFQEKYPEFFALINIPATPIKSKPAKSKVKAIKEKSLDIITR